MNVGEQLGLGQAMASLGRRASGRAVIQSRVSAIRSSGTWRIVRKTSGVIWTRPENGSWRCTAANPKQRAVAAAKLTEPTESDSQTESLAAHWADESDVDATATWLEIREHLHTAGGAEHSQSTSASWLELRQDGASWIAVTDGLALLPLPASASADAELAAEDVIVLAPTASAALAAGATHELARRYRAGHLRLGRDRVAPAGFSLCRDPRVAPTLPKRDAEGTPRRFTPLISRGVAVGLISDRASAAEVGMSRSSGSLIDLGDDLAVELDALALTTTPRGPASPAQLARDVSRGWLLHTIVAGPDGGLFAPWASRIQAGTIAPTTSRLALPASPLALLGVIEAIGGTAEITALFRQNSRPMQASCPPVRLRAGIAGR